MSAISTHPFEQLKQRSGALSVTGAYEGLDTQAIAQTAVRRQAPILYIASQNAPLKRFMAQCRFFAPDLPRMEFPAPDNLPYDRVSPSVEQSARRMASLSLLTRIKQPRAMIIATTPAAAIQKVPPKNIIQKASFSAKPGSILNHETLLEFLQANGYQREAMVHEPGHYAIRGGIIDLFPPGSKLPVRIDLFGDQIDSLRAFDPQAQKSLRQLRDIRLSPASEILLGEDHIARFRSAYREYFGVDHEDPLYEAISAGQRWQGAEQFLPLFYGKLDSIFDYLPPETVVAMDHLALDAAQSRYEMAEDHYSSRKQAAEASKKSYKALPPEQLYLNESQLEEAALAFDCHYYSPFQAEGSQTGPRIDLGGKLGVNFAAQRAAGENIYDAVITYLNQPEKKQKRFLLAGWSAGSSERMAQILSEHGLDGLAKIKSFDELKQQKTARAILPLEHGFETRDWITLCEQDILGNRLANPSRKRRRAKNFLSEASSLNPGDLVVHVDHGIGRFDGLHTLTIQNAPHDCLELTYARGDKVFLPVENIELLSRYGADESDARLDKLGGTAWQARKAKAKKRLLEMAGELMRVAAARLLKKTPVLEPPSGAWNEFQAGFPYEETEDQLNAIEDVVADLSKGQPMDRLICGDVGFGKTEVALRAAFVAAMEGRQVAVITPTTLLARQHFKNFTDRFADWPLKIGHLSRLVGTAQAKEVKEKLAKGEIDIVIGTHALLSKQVNFRDLGLLVIDEEQRFGVKHKERLKELRADMHVLTLSATPIPRTLQLALSGVRELSLIATPPVDRLVVHTYVSRWDPVTIREALLREKYRGGQSYFVAPRISDLPEIEEFLRQQVPEVSFVVAHGRLPGTQLDEIMNRFYDGAYDVLLSTTIVESGLDIPTANSLIVWRADKFGLAQLYQLRGRVGRSKLRAYAYLTTPTRKKLTDGAQKRLKLLQSLDSLGAGFTLASHDLDMRGGGNMLGEEQSGHIKEVGVELYQKMLEEAVAEQKGQGGMVAESDWSPTINLGVPVLIPETYVEDLGLRLSLYRRLSDCEDDAQRDAFAAELTDRFGSLPEEVEALIDVAGLKAICKQLSIEKLEAGEKGASIQFRVPGFSNAEKLVAHIAQRPGQYKLKPDGKLLLLARWKNAKQRLSGCKNALQNLVALC